MAKQGKYKTKELIPKYREAGEREAPEKWVGGKYVGQAGELYKHQPLAVKYLTEEERAPYEIRLGKRPSEDEISRGEKPSEDPNLFYWEKTGEVFNTTKMTSVGGQSKAKGRAIFVMTESGKIYAADEGAETGAGVKAAKEARWRFNHSSFLWGEPVAAAGELIFEKGGLVGVTDMSGHYHPGVNEMRQVIQEFMAQGIDVSGVWVFLNTVNWYVTGQNLIDHPDVNEAENFKKNGIGSAKP
jgi:hypothetical protein